MKSWERSTMKKTQYSIFCCCCFAFLISFWSAGLMNSEFHNFMRMKFKRSRVWEKHIQQAVKKSNKVAQKQFSLDCIFSTSSLPWKNSNFQIPYDVNCSKKLNAMCNYWSLIPAPHHIVSQLLTCIVGTFPSYFSHQPDNFDLSCPAAHEKQNIAFFPRKDKKSLKEFKVIILFCCSTFIPKLLNGVLLMDREAREI